MTKPRNAALLVRISEDRGGEAAGVGRQEADARALASRLGWTVKEVFTENDTSAYKRRKLTLPDGSTAMRVLRPEFRRLLDQMSSGQVDGLIAYHLDRVARDPRDLEDLIDVVERAHVPVESVTGSLRLATDADVTMARIGVAIANQSSRDASRRIKRKHQELAEQGRFAGGGARRYGYEKDGVTIREAEAETIRWCAARVLEGATVSSLVRELDRQGVRPVKAASWSTKTLHDILRSPRVAGLRVHQGAVAGPAQWSAILDRETWEAVVATLHGRSRGTTKPSLRHWLNGVLFCGLCGYALSASQTSPKSRQKYRYWCNTHRADGCGRIAISGPGAENEVTRQVLEYLARPDVLQALSGATSERSSAAARREIAEDEQQLRDLSRLWAEKSITLDEYATARKIIDGRLNGARAVLTTHVPSRLRHVLTASDAAGAWGDLAPSDKRELIRLLLASGGYRGWEIAPADLTKARRFDPDRFRLSATRPAIEQLAGAER